LHKTHDGSHQIGFCTDQCSIAHGSLPHPSSLRFELLGFAMVFGISVATECNRFVPMQEHKIKIS
jgi:hypothetical protein